MNYMIREITGIHGNTIRKYFNIVENFAVEIRYIDVIHGICDTIAKDNDTTREDVYDVLCEIMNYLSNDPMIETLHDHNIQYQDIFDWMKIVCHEYFVDHFKTNIKDEVIII